MRSALLLLAPAALVLQAGAPEPPQPTHAEFLGRWEGRDDAGTLASIELGADGYAALHMNGQTLGGRAPGGPALRFRLDVDRSPAWLDFNMVDAAGKRIGRLLALIEIVAPGKLRLMIGDSPEVRPTGFQAATPKNCITLTRIQ
jgi:hypothetical protein